MAEMTGRIVAIDELTDAHRRQMFAVFARYYEDISYERFSSDLAPKDHVILLFDRAGEVQGFSTMQNLEVRRGGRLHRGLFSGDTVVAEEFWGQRVLGRLFLRHLWVQKLRHPFDPFWWFLISKGYKTYLLMANNFAEHYPRFERATPEEARSVLDAFATELFAREYRQGQGVIAFEKSMGHLKSGVAPVTTEMLENPRIRFFQERNPDWAAGTELACLARMTWSMPAYYGLKAIAKKWARFATRVAALPSAVQESRRP